LAARVRQLYPRTAVIMVTAYGNDALREQATDVSIQHVLDKPVELVEIRSAALEALGGSENGQAGAD
jgi:CheY-like chemotaxis protein